jgi:hypothetical protein
LAAWYRSGQNDKHSGSGQADRGSNAQIVLDGDNYRVAAISTTIATEILLNQSVSPVFDRAGYAVAENRAGTHSVAASIQLSRRP